MPFTDEFIKKENVGKEYLSDIEISVCSFCGITQNVNDTDMDNYYNDYEYSVGGSAKAKKFMAVLADRTKDSFFNVASDSVPKVLEIGSGSGEQLEMYRNSGFSVIGVEPSKLLSRIANEKDIPTLNYFFNDDLIKSIPEEFRELDCIVSSYTFDHIPYINETFKTIDKILKDDGKLIVEVHDLDLIRKRNEFCLFEHEHYIYLNKKTAEYLFKLNGFNIITFDLLSDEEKRANSLLIVAEKCSDRSIVESKNVFDSGLETLNDKISKNIENIDSWLEANRHKKIAGYGCGGRGVMTLAALKNYSCIEFVVDKNPKGKNIFLPKTHLPVKEITALKDNKVDFIIIFSYGYFDEIIEELIPYGYRRDQFISLLEF
jgi:SAM-dependent methyltransferase